MNHALVSLLVTFGLLLGMLLFLEIGRRLGARRLARLGKDESPGVGVVDGAVFGLLGLLMAFTFSGAASRFDVRRQLVVEEANAIGTAYLRIDVLPESARPALRELFRTYLNLRLEVYRKLPDLAAARQALDESSKLQGSIWSQAIASCKAVESTAPTMLLLPAINEMIDITTTRTMAAETHPPLVIFGMLIALALAGSLLAGNAMMPAKSRHWMHMLTFAFVMAASVYVILDLEFPRVGLIRVDAFDRVLEELHASMK